MKQLVLSTLLLFSIHNLLSAKYPIIEDNYSTTTKLLCGKVIDKNTGEEIAGAEIKIGEETIYSDFNGNFFTVVKSNKVELWVKFVSYNDTKITLDYFSYTPIVIELE